MTSLLLAHVFQSLFTFELFHFVLIGGNLTAESTGRHRGIGGGFKFQGCSCKLSFLFLSHRESGPESLLTGYQLTKYSPEISTCPQKYFILCFLVKSYFPVLIFPWNYLPCVCNLEYNFNTVLHCTHAKLQGIWYGYICLWQHSFHGNGENSFLKQKNETCGLLTVKILTTNCFPFYNNCK